MSVGSIIEAVFVYTMFAVFAFVIIAGIVGRILGWSDPSAPFPTSHIENKHKIDAELKDAVNSVRFRPSYGVIRNLRSTRDLHKLERENNITEYVLEKWKHHSGVKVQPAPPDLENPPLSSSLSTYPPPSSYISNVTTSISTKKFDPFRLTWTTTVTTTVSQQDQSGTLPLMNLQQGSNLNQTLETEKQYYDLNRLHGGSISHLQQQNSSLSPTPYPSPTPSPYTSPLKLSPLPHPHQLVNRPHQVNEEKKVNNNFTLTLPAALEQQQHQQLELQQQQVDQQLNGSVDSSISDRIGNLENMLENISTKLDKGVSSPSSESTTRPASSSSSRGRARSKSASRSKSAKRNSMKEIVTEVKDEIKNNLKDENETETSSLNSNNSSKKDKRNSTAKSHVNKLVSKLNTRGKNNAKVHVEINDNNDQQDLFLEKNKNKASTPSTSSNNNFQNNELDNGGRELSNNSNNIKKDGKSSNSGSSGSKRALKSTNSKSSFNSKSPTSSKSSLKNTKSFEVSSFDISSFDQNLNEKTVSKQIVKEEEGEEQGGTGGKDMKPVHMLSPNRSVKLSPLSNDLKMKASLTPTSADSKQES